MIKAVVEKSSAHLMVEGGGVEILEDTSRLIHAVYSAISKQDTRFGRVYRDLLLEVLDDPESPVWTICDDDKSVVVDMAELKRQMEEGQ